MAEKRVLFCDRCDSDEAGRWVVGRAGRTLTEIDLCDTCVTELTDFIKDGRPHRPKRKNTYRRFQKTQVEPR